MNACRRGLCITTACSTGATSAHHQHRIRHNCLAMRALKAPARVASSRRLIAACVHRARRVARVHAPAADQQKVIRLHPCRTASTAVLDTATADASDRTVTEPGQEPAKPLNWYQQWYPVAPVEDLDPAKPHPFTLLNLPLVLWADKAGTWHAFADRCPHRLAPLSEGRIEGDELMCSYHGWQFDRQGQCTRIPQIGDPKAQATACSSSRSCVAAYSTEVHHGLLWVWPDADAALAAATPAAVIQELDQPGWSHRTQGWFARDLPLSMEAVVENVMDPCHANFTHHGVQGRRENEKGSQISVTSPVSPGGFQLQHSTANFTADITFQAPCFLKYNFGKFGRSMNVYVVPTKPGYCRMITKFMADDSAPPPPSAKGPMALVFKMVGLLEGTAVLEHNLLRNKVLDGDNYIIHVQERQRHAEGADNWQQSFYMPGKFDTGVATWYTWLNRFGQELPVMAHSITDLPPLMSRQQVLDRFEQHTKHCTKCQKALKKVDLALPATWAAAVALLLVAATAALQGAALLSPQVLGCGIAAAAAALLHRGLNKFRDQFFFIDYVHAEKN